MRRIKVERVKWEFADKVIVGVLLFTTVFLLAHIVAALVVRVW